MQTTNDKVHGSKGGIPALGSVRAEDLKHLGPAQLLDVRLAEDFAAAHIAGAKSNCVFEVAFIQRLTETAPDLNATTVVYGANSQSQEAHVAATKLGRRGYTDLHVLEGGLEAARAAQLKLVEGETLPSEPREVNGRQAIDLERSRVEWCGRNLLNKHFGTVALASGHLDFERGLLKGGEVLMDMNRIECSDLAGDELHDVLIAHLRDDDFFDAANYPTTRLVVESSVPADSPAPGSLNLKVSGTLNLRGVTHPVEFEAATGMTDDGRFVAQGTLGIDRTRWGVLYGSGKFFHRLGGHLVNDLIEVEFRLVTGK